MPFYLTISWFMYRNVVLSFLFLFIYFPVLFSFLFLSSTLYPAKNHSVSPFCTTQYFNFVYLLLSNFIPYCRVEAWWDWTQCNEYFIQNALSYWKFASPECPFHNLTFFNSWNYVFHWTLKFDIIIFPHSFDVFKTLALFLKFFSFGYQNYADLFELFTLSRAKAENVLFVANHHSR